MSEARARIGRWDQYQRRTVKVPSRRRSSSASERTTCTTDEKAALANDEVLVELIVAMSAECRESRGSSPNLTLEGARSRCVCARGRGSNNRARFDHRDSLSFIVVVVVGCLLAAAIIIIIMAPRKQGGGCTCRAVLEVVVCVVLLLAIAGAKPAAKERSVVILHVTDGTRERHSCTITHCSPL